MVGEEMHSNLQVSSCEGLTIEFRQRGSKCFANVYYLYCCLSKTNANSVLSKHFLKFQPTKTLYQNNDKCNALTA